MNVAVSKVFASFINKTAKELGFKAHAEVVEMSDRQYQLSVGDIYDACDYRDYTGAGNLKAIMVTYPDDYYACPQYLSTKTLVNEFRGRGVKTLDELKEMLRDMLEI